MGRFLDSLKVPSPVFEIEENEAGFMLRGEGDAFSAVVRRALNEAGEDFVALPISDGHVGYEGCQIIPL